jgi:serine/threonine-protein kinase
MTQPQASRLDRRRQRPKKFLSGVLPEGSLLRGLVLYGLVPLVILFILIVAVDNLVMPTVTRHGSEFPLPEFEGRKLTEVQIPLQELDLEYEVASEEFSPGAERGTILRQYPVGGTKVKSGRTVKFVVSAGQKMVPIPEVAGMSVRQAILNLETAGLELGDIAWAFSDTLPERVVVVSYPPAGTEIAAGSPVTLMVNRGRSADFTYVPRVVGLTLDEATEQLEKKQLKLGIVTRRLNDEYLPETVLEQSEAEGTELEPGTEIDLVVSVME